MRSQLISWRAKAKVARSSACYLQLEQKRHYYMKYAEDFLKTSAYTLESDKPLSVDVLVCGAGLVGASLTYHLAKRGDVKVLLMDQGRIGGGGTWLTNGLISGHLLWQPQMTPLANYSNKLYSELNEKYKDIELTRCGRLLLARSDFSLVDIQRMHSLSRAYNHPSVLMKGDETLEYCSSLNIKDIQAALLLNDDARLNPLALCIAMIREAKRAGATIVENCSINLLKVNDEGLLYGAETDCGYIECKNFVNTAGLWAPKIPIESNNPGLRVNIPNQPCYFSYLAVKPFKETTAEMPIIHDLDANVFLYRGDENSLICAGYDEQSSRPVETSHKIFPRDLNFQQLPEEWDLFLPIMEKLTHRFPSIDGSEIKELVTTARAFTPDGHILVGPMPRISNYFVASGMNVHASTVAGGLGKLMTEWVINGAPNQDISKIDVARFLSAHSNRQYLKSRVPEVVSLSYILLGHSNQYSQARFLRASPIHQNLRQAGAVFGEIMGYERPLYFASDRVSPEPAIGEDLPFGKPVWFNYVASEYQACRERVGLMDMSNFSKFIIGGPEEEVVEFLQRVCSADIDKPVGASIFTGMQHEQGGYVTDCTVNRMTRNEFFMIAPTVQQVRVKVWLHKHVTKGSGVYIQDVTSMYTALNVVGPLSRHLMQDLTDAPMSASAFPAFSCREINLGCASGIKAVSITHCGELGWVLYVPNEFALHVFKTILNAGQSYGIQHAGYYTLRQLRIEKFYVYWGQDIDWTTTPTQCGRLFRVNFNKQFIGRKALLEEKKTGVKRRYVQLLLDDHNLHKDPWPQGGEPVYRNGQFCGLTTTAAYGFTLNCQVCLGYVVRPDPETGAEMTIDDLYILDPTAKYEVDVCGRIFRATACLHSPSLPMMSSEHPTHYRPTQY